MNEQVFFWFYTLGQKLGASSVYFLANLLPGVLFFGLGLWSLATKHRMKTLTMFLSSLVSALAAWLLVDLLKSSFVNPRPFEVLNIIPIVATNLGDAWPSGHASFMSAWAAAFWLQDKRAGAVLLVGAVIVGLARIMAGVHYPLDVLTGWFLGGLIGGGLIFVFGRLKRGCQRF